MNHIQKFLLELGVGFSSVGRPFHLEVKGSDYHIDLLFYHLKIRCFVVIDLKMEEFSPEHAGKMNFYLSVVDEWLRQPGDRPSIGLVLNKTKKKSYWRVYPALYGETNRGIKIAHTHCDIASGTAAGKSADS
ncbi:MAG: PDDEXK nuclease domain-containing protein [Methanomicrobiales archaeon]